MNISAASDLAAVPRTRNRLRPAFEACKRAWNSLSRRHWLIAAAIGVLYGTGNAAFVFLYAGGSAVWAPDPWFRIFANMLTRWILLMTAVSLALAFGLALLRDIGQRGAVRPRDVVLTILAVSAFGAMVVDPIVVFGPTRIMHSWLRVQAQPFIADTDWLTALTRMYSQTTEKVATFVSTVALASVYYFKGSRTSDALAAAQLGLSEAQRRALGEELRSAQAAVDPEFLFATLAEVDRRFESDPEVAQRLLDALIRYLRAALPTHDEAIGTLGQQSTLVRAYLDIEAIRSAGRLQGAIDVPPELEARPFAPALVLPLVALAASRNADAECDTRVEVRASLLGGRLIVEVQGDGSPGGLSVEQESTLASLRQRVSVLYGSQAELSFVPRGPRGSSAKIVIADPGSL